MRQPSVCGTISLGLCIASPLAAAQPADRGEQIVAAFRKATGGSAWDRIGSCRERGTHQDGAVAYETNFSLKRYGIRLDSHRGSGPKRSNGFDGSVAWQTTPSGVAVERDAAALREALTTAYLSSNGFFFPMRFAATFRYLHPETYGGRQFDVVEIKPQDGNSLDYWFERRSHLLLRVIDRHGAQPSIVEAADYRAANGIRVAFRLTVTTPDGQLLDRGAVTSLTCVADDKFSFAPPVG